VSRCFAYVFYNILLRSIPGTHFNGVRMSDHRDLKAVFDTGSNSRGPGY
jgi:hypothetical protein